MGPGDFKTPGPRSSGFKGRRPLVGIKRGNAPLTSSVHRGIWCARRIRTCIRSLMRGRLYRLSYGRTGRPCRGGKAAVYVPGGYGYGGYGFGSLIQIGM